MRQGKFTIQVYRVKRATLTRQVFLDAGFDEFPHSHGGRLGCGGRKAGGLNVSPHRDTAGPRLQLASESRLTESELCLCAPSHLYLRPKR